LDVPAAYAFNYHFDNGVFRGLAFANYRTPEETEIVVNTINGLEIGGRKLRVEYKKMLPNMMDSNSHDNITVNIIRKKERDTPSSQPGSPLLSERKLPTNPDEGNIYRYMSTLPDD
jgi:RNA recognition motif-containing protein